MWRLGVFFAMLALATLPAPVVRGGAPAGVNATDLSMVDADFAFQGEYAGGVKTPGGQEMRLGAQVIALGAGKFNAVIYAGGLPGDGWTRNDKSAALEGEKHGEAVVLKGDGVSGEIHAEKLTLQHADHPGRAVLETVQRKSPTLGAKPPEGAMVIFDGSGTQMFVEGRINERGCYGPGRRPGRCPTRTSCTWSSSRPTCRTPAAKAAPTAASTFTTATRSRSSTRSAWPEKTTNAAASTQSRRRT